MRIPAALMITLLLIFPCGAEETRWDLSGEYRACAMDEETVRDCLTLKAGWKPDERTMARASLVRSGDEVTLSGTVMRTGSMFFAGGDFHGRFGAGLIQPGERPVILDPYAREEPSGGRPSFSPVSGAPGGRSYRGAAIGWVSSTSPVVEIRSFYSLRRRWSTGEGEEPRLLRDRLFEEKGRDESVQLHDGGAAFCLYPGGDVMCELYGLGSSVRDSNGKSVSWPVNGLEGEYRCWTGYGALCRYDDGSLHLWAEGGMTALGSARGGGWHRGNGILWGMSYSHPSLQLTCRGSARGDDFYAPDASEARGGVCVEGSCEFTILPCWKIGGSIIGRERSWIYPGSVWRAVNRREELFTSISLPVLRGRGNFVHIEGPAYGSTRYTAGCIFLPEKIISPGLGMQLQERRKHWSMAGMTTLASGPRRLRISLGGGLYRVKPGNPLYGGLPWRSGVSMPGLYIMSRSGWVAAVTLVISCGAASLEGGYGISGRGRDIGKSQMEFGGRVSF